MREAEKWIKKCKDYSHTCTLKEVTENINKQVDAMSGKLATWEEKNKKIWKDIIPKRFETPEPINQDFSLTFETVMGEYIAKAPIDMNHVRIIQLELLPAEVREYINTLRISQGDKYRPRIQELQNNYLNKFNEDYKALNLPMCLSFINQNSNKESSIPEDLKVRINQVKIKGNLDSIEAFFKQLSERETQNAQTLTSIEAFLNTERIQDADLRTKGGNVQGRVPSDMAARNYVDSVAKYRKDMGLASQANKKLKEMFDKNKQGFEILFKSDNELEEIFEPFKVKKASEKDLEE